MSLERFRVLIAILDKIKIDPIGVQMNKILFFYKQKTTHPMINGFRSLRSLVPIWSAYEDRNAFLLLAIS